MTMDDDWEVFKHQVVIDKVNEAIRSDPKNWRNNLEAIGMEYHDDEPTTIELTPQTETEHYLAAYFDGHIPYQPDMFKALIHDVVSEVANFDFYEQYLIAGNRHFLHLILEGLSEQPYNPILLEPLLIFHHYHPILPQVIGCYTQACLLADDEDDLFDMAYEFIVVTTDDGYDAMVQLRKLFAESPEKLQLLDDVDSEMQKSRKVVHF